MDYKRGLFVLIGMIALIIAFSDFSPGAEDSDSSTLNVTVGEKTMIDMTPSSFSWTGLDPGTQGATKHAQIENIGSTNLTEIWFNVTQPSSRPFGTGTNISYDAGNMVYISRESGTYYAVDRIEFNETRSLVYLVDPYGNSPPNSSFSYGRFRNASGEYFWMFDRTSQKCDEIEFYVGDIAHTKYTTGNIDFSSCDAGLNNGPTTNCRTGILSNTNNENWCYADINIGGDSYVIAVNNNTQDRVRWSHWNQDFPGTDTASNDEKFYTGLLYPGNSTVANITVRIPFGVAKGRLNQGTLYVIGSNQL